MRTLGKEYGMSRGNWEVHGGLGNLQEQHKKKQWTKHIFVLPFHITN